MASCTCLQRRAASLQGNGVDLQAVIEKCEKFHGVMEWPGLKRTTVITSSNPLLCAGSPTKQPRLPRATSSLALDACKDGASTASLGNLFSASPHWVSPVPLSIILCLLPKQGGCGSPPSRGKWGAPVFCEALCSEHCTQNTILTNIFPFSESQHAVCIGRRGFQLCV